MYPIERLWLLWKLGWQPLIAAIQVLDEEKSGYIDRHEVIPHPVCTYSQFWLIVPRAHGALVAVQEGGGSLWFAV